jgi:hypothetical protein
MGGFETKASSAQKALASDNQKLGFQGGFSEKKQGFSEKSSCAFQSIVTPIYYGVNFRR